MARLKYVMVLTVVAVLGVCFVPGDTGRAYPWNPQPLHPGFCATLAGGPIGYASPVVGELDTDGKLEIVVAGDKDGWIYAINDDGTLLWQYNVVAAIDAASYQTAGKVVIASTPAIADLDLDGFEEVVVGVGTDTDTLGHNGGMLVLDHTGHLYSGWPRMTLDIYANGFSDGIWSSPALGDLDGDGDLEIVAGSFDQRVYAWHHNGQPLQGWPQYVEDTVWPSPALADIDKDGYLNVIIGTDNFGASGGYLRVFKPDGTELAGFPQYVDQALYSSPAVGDLNGDGWLEIVSGTGNYFANRGYAVYAWDHTGALLPGWPVTTDSYVMSPPALGDMDGDGQLEVVVGTQGGKIYALNANGSSVPGWPVQALDNFAHQGPIGFSSAIFANFDADATLETMLVFFGDVMVLDQDGAYLTHSTGDANTGKPSMFINYGGLNSAAVADLNADGSMEVVHAGGSQWPDGGNAYVCAWQMTATSVASPWTAFRGNSRHTATVLPAVDKAATVVSHDIPALLLPGATYAFTVTMKNTGSTSWTADGQYRLAALPGDPLAAVTSVGLAPAETVASGENKSFVVTLHTPATPGYYKTQWRMAGADGVGFGMIAARRVKVGNEPALYVLASDDGGVGNGVYPVGIAPAIAPPTDLQDWRPVKGLGFSSQRADGYFVMDGYGTVRYGGTIDRVGSNHPWDQAGNYQELIVPRHGTGYHLLTRYGVVYASNGANPFSPAPPTFAQPVARSAAITANDRGIYVLDGSGNVYTGGAAPALTPATPNFGADIAKRIKLTGNGTGYYVLDAYGRVWNGGAAPAITPNYTVHINEDWARDFELTADGLGYYLLDKEGHIYTGGTAVAPTINLAPVWTGQDVALDLALADSRILEVTYLSASSESLGFLALPDETRARSLNLTTTGLAASVNWTASESIPWLTLSATSGATPAPLTVSVDTAGLSVGTYDGEITFTSPDVENSPLTLSVRLVVAAALRAVYLPTILR